MNRVVVIDTIGEHALHPTFTKALGHVTFYGHSPAAWRDGRGTVHPHGGWCGWHLLTQDKAPTDCHLIQYLGPDNHPNPRPVGLDEWLFGTLRDLDLGPRDTVSCSWGSIGPGRFVAEWMRRFRYACGGATIYFASGNSGAGTRSWPQVHAWLVPYCFVVGAIARTGTRAEFSSGVDFEPYVHLAALGDGGLALDPFTGKITPWRGTSQACPRVAGAMRAAKLYGRDVIHYARAFACADDDADGLPEGIAPRWRDVIASGGWNPEVGAGNVEGMVQAALRQTGLSLGSWRSDIAGVPLEIEGMQEDIPPLEG